MLFHCCFLQYNRFRIAYKLFISDYDFDEQKSLASRLDWLIVCLQIAVLLMPFYLTLKYLNEKNYMLSASSFTPTIGLRALGWLSTSRSQLSSTITYLIAGVVPSLLVFPARAQNAAGGGGSLLQGIMPLVLIFVVMYFLLIRPQQKRQKQHRELVSQLKRGDKVLTSGGLYASVIRSIDERDIEVELAGKLRVKMLRTSVIELVSPTLNSKNTK